MSDISNKILAVITARGGSKGVPRKNIRDVNGKPLIAYVIEALLGAGDALYKVVVSTDDAEIAQIARSFGADVPFMRPAELAGDQAASLSVVQHAVEMVEAQDNLRLGGTILVQPTNPFLTAQDVLAGVNIFLKHPEATSVVSVVENTANHPLKALIFHAGLLKPYIQDAPQAVRRQDLVPVFKRNGAFYMTRRNVLMDDNDLYGDHVFPCIMPDISAVDIDTELDLQIAEILLQKRQAGAL